MGLVAHAAGSSFFLVGMDIVKILVAVSESGECCELAFDESFVVAFGTGCVDPRCVLLVV